MRKYLKEGKYSYEQTDILGSGCFGKVYRGYDHHNQKWIALKQIQLQKLQQAGDQLKHIVLSQITVMKKFTNNMKIQPCEYIVCQQDCFRTQKYIYIVMQLCQGGTLQSQMKNKKYTQSECHYIIYCLAKGLQYMANMHIVHRDLKPQNIFITKNPQTGMKIYKLGDFGFATHKKNLDLAMGTLMYMAPEMFSKGNYTNKVDVWSFGVICYQIFFRVMFFNGKDKWAIKDSIIKKPFKLSQYQKSAISPEYQSFLELCLIKQPSYRLAPESLFHHPFLKNYNPPLISPRKQNQPLKQDTFTKIQILIDQCQRLRNMAQKFSAFSLQTGRITQFIQIYLLKDAYAMMNRIAYTMIHRVDYIGMHQEQFQQILQPQNQNRYQILTKQSQNQCLYVTGLFNDKYKQFKYKYISKFDQKDVEKINKVINQEPYQYTNQKVMEKQLGKWVKVLSKYPKYKDLQQNCDKVYQIKISS